MDALNFGVQVIAISTSGVLSPGPLFFANMLYGTRYGTRAGLKIAYGHTVVELPLVVLLAAGLLSAFATVSQYTNVIGLVGGIGILGFAAMQIVGVVRKKHDKPVDGEGAVYRRHCADRAQSVLSSMVVHGRAEAGI